MTRLSHRIVTYQGLRGTALSKPERSVADQRAVRRFQLPRAVSEQLSTGCYMFELQRMGWHGFQRLCITICREVLGQTVESFLDGNDAGMDGAFIGAWTPIVGQEFTGRFVIQCKFTARPQHSITLSELEAEIAKAGALVDLGLCDIYVLMTNAGMSGRTRAAFEKRLLGVGVKKTMVLQSGWIEEQITTRKRLRLLVPQMYGLGDLTQILDERAYSQAKAVLESMRDDLRKVVVTNSYHAAADALDKHRFVLLIGEPASGKTTIASMLAMASVDQWGASVVKLHDPTMIVDHWNPNEPSQFFWIDDAFGVTQYESELARGWNRVIPQVIGALRGGARIVMTSRDYIYNRARLDLKKDAFPLFDESQVVIDVRDLSDDEKRQILYNHMKLGRQAKEFKTEIKGHLTDVAEHPRFIPEIARRLADPLFTKKLTIGNFSLAQFVDRREQILVDICRSLDDDSKAALALIYMRNGQLESPIQLSETEKLALLSMSSDIGLVNKALQSLKDSFVLYIVSDETACWTYKHPTVGDAFSDVLRGNPELLGVFVAGTEVGRLTQQVTCGDVNIERAVVLPPAIFGQVIERLSSYQASSEYKTQWMSRWGAKRTLYSFLSRRCTKGFLEQYLLQFPELIDSVTQPGLYLSWAPEVDLCCRLFELGLLPEDARVKFVETVSAYAIAGQDASVLTNKRMKAMLSQAELDSLKDQMLSDLLPRLADVRKELQGDYGSSDNSHQHIQPFIDVAGALRDEFGNDPGVCATVLSEIAASEEWASDNAQSEDALEPRELTIGEQEPQGMVARDIFEDVDE